MYQKIVKPSLDQFFVVSDLHYGHDRDFIWGKRGFQSCHEHDSIIAQEWNRRVTNQDEVCHLGDLSFGDQSGEKTKELLLSLNFKTLYLMGGNHTSGFKKLYDQARKEFFGKETDLEVFPLATKLQHKQIVFLPNLVEVKVGRDVFILCHYPIISHNSQAHGTYMVCGHSHGNCAVTNRYTGKGRRIDVGIENFGGPVPLKFVVDFLKDRDYDCVDHH